MGQLHVSTLAKDKALATTFATRWIDTRSAFVAHLQWSSDNTSSPVGAITIEESNDPQVETEQWNTSGESTASTAKAINISADTTRVVILGTGLTVNAVNNTEVIVHSPARYIRLKYTASTGGATAKAQIWVSARE